MVLSQLKRLAGQHLHCQTAAGCQIQDKDRRTEGNRLEDQTRRDEEQAIKRGRAALPQNIKEGMIEC